jgi:hypothetical protein
VATLHAEDPGEAVALLTEASRQLLLPVDIDLHFRSLVERDLEPASIVEYMRVYLRTRRRGGAG